MEATEKAVIINAAMGSWYPQGQKRLLRSLNEWGWNFDIKTWVNEFPMPGYNEENPYNIKGAAFEWAIKQGYQYIIWLDCSVWCVKNPNIFMDYLYNEGYYFYKSGYNCAQTSSDKALSYFGITRDQAELMPECASNTFAINLKQEQGKKFADLFVASCKAGVFNGSRYHDNQSEDKRFLFHRQDQTAASIIANILGFKLLDPNVFTSYRDYVKEIPESVFFCLRGM